MNKKYIYLNAVGYYTCVHIQFVFPEFSQNSKNKDCRNKGRQFCPAMHRIPIKPLIIGAQDTKIPAMSFMYTQRSSSDTKLASR
jgi:hypothetical protein